MASPFPIAAALAVLLAASPSVPVYAAPSVVSDCANPELPASILAVTPEHPADSPLPETIARAAHADLVLAVADDENSRELGLMCVLRLKPQHGMIFVFDGSDRRQEFWMKNTLVPLDMIWVHKDGRVDTVAENVPASTRTTPDDKIARRSGVGSYVIELAAGEAKTDAIKPGDWLAISLGK